MKTRFVLILFPLTLLARPLDIRSPNLEPSRGAKPRPPIMVPVGCDKLLSSGCAVSSSDTQVDPKTLAAITDGNKECGEGSSVKLAPGLQWVQIDLGKTQPIYAVFIWRSLPQPHVCRDVGSSFPLMLCSKKMWKPSSTTITTTRPGWVPGQTRSTLRPSWDARSRSAVSKPDTSAFTATAASWTKEEQTILTTTQK